MKKRFVCFLLLLITIIGFSSGNEYVKRLDEFRDSIAALRITQKQLVERYGDNYSLKVTDYERGTETVKGSKVYRYLYNQDSFFVFFYNAQSDITGLYSWQINPDIIKSGFKPKTREDCIDYFGGFYNEYSNRISYGTDEGELYFVIEGEEIIKIGWHAGG
jgi:hypothetical protein